MKLKEIFKTKFKIRGKNNICNINKKNARGKIVSDGNYIFAQKQHNENCQKIFLNIEGLNNKIIIKKFKNRQLINKARKTSGNCIVGYCSTILEIFDEKNCILASVPGRIVKTGVDWSSKISNETGAIVALGGASLENRLSRVA